MTDSPSRGVILVAVCYSWMRPFVQSVVNDMWDDHTHLVVVITHESQRADFSHLPSDRVHIICEPKGWVSTKIYMLYPRRVIRVIERLIREVHPRAVLSIASDQPLWRYLPRLQKRMKVFYTVHDTHAHPIVNPTWRTRLFYRYWFERPLLRLLSRMKRQIVNCRWQGDLLRRMYPDHELTYLPFPSLVTDEMKQSTMELPDDFPLKPGFILFFGRVDLYKGVERVIDAVRHSRRLQEIGFVIAGAGVLSDEQPLPPGVLWLNRYIPDGEVAALMRAASVVVYPYLQATQSGVVSIASYFGRPMVLSDIPFFREVGADTDGVTLVDVNDRQALSAALLAGAADTSSTYPLYTRLYATFDWHTPFARLLRR